MCVMDELEQIIQYEFKDKELLKRALSHTSYVNEVRSSDGSNERLEDIASFVRF